MKDDLRYTPSDCFETFPFPENPEAESALTAAGERYYTFRAELMVRNDEGLTTTYNRFHDPNEDDPEILQLRELHDAMDRAVLAAYGWTDLDPRCEFLLDYEDEDDDGASTSKKSTKKKPWRYRWPDFVQEEMLAKLLELNQARAEAERPAGLRGKASKGKKKAKKRAKKKTAKTTSAKTKTAKTKTAKTTTATAKSAKTTTVASESTETAARSTTAKASKTKTKSTSKAQSERVAKAESTSAAKAKSKAKTSAKSKSKTAAKATTKKRTRKARAGGVQGGLFGDE